MGIGTPRRQDRLAVREEPERTVHGLTVVDADSLDAAADVIRFPEDDPDPSPASPNLRALPRPESCFACHGYGVAPMVPATPYSGQPCWACNGSGTDAAPAPAAPDRTER